MKRILQKSFYRLRTLLLLMVMFVAGSSAWAESSVTYSFRGGAKTYGPDENGITISCSLLYQQGANIYGGSFITITSENPITRVELTDCSASGYGVGSGFGALIVEGSGKGKMTNNGESATWTTTGTETSVSFTTGDDFCVGRVEVFYEGEDDGSVKSTLNFASTAWNLSVNGETAVPTSGCHFDTRDVFTNADGVTMTLTNVASRGEGGLNSERKGSGYAQSWPNECYYSQYQTGYYAMYFCNGEGFTLTAPSGYTLNKIVVNRPSNNSQYSMTSLIMDGVQNTNTASGTWTGEAESVAFSTISGDATKRILVSNIQVTLMPIADEGEVTYTINLVDAPAGAYVTLDGQNFNESNNTYTIEKSFGKNDLTVYEPEGYYADVEYTRDNHTYTVTYKAYNYYDVTIVGTTNSAAGVVYNNQTYGNGSRIETKDVLNLGSVEPVEIDGMDSDVTFANNLYTVTYTKPAYIRFDFKTGISYNKGGIQASTDNRYPNSTKGTNIYDDYKITVTAESPIEKIVFNGLQGYNSNNSHNVAVISGGGSWKGNNNSTSPATWVAGANCTNVVFGSTDGSDMYIESIDVYLKQLEEIEYTVNFTGNIPEGATITIGDNVVNYSGSHTFTTTSVLDESYVSNVYENDNYYAEVDYTEDNHTFTVNYIAYTKYSVELAEGSEYTGAEAGVVVSGATDVNGSYPVGANVIKSKGDLQQSNFAAKEVARYDGTVTLEGYTATVKYTEKQMPPFAFNRFTPATGETMSGISSIICMADGSSFVQVTDDKEVEGNNIYYDLTFTYVLGEDETEADRKQNQVVRAQYTNNGYYATLKFKKWYGETKSDYTFDESGTWTVNLPEGFASLTDGSKNNAATVTYTIKLGPQFVSATPASGSNITNNDLIDGNFTMTFDKNLSSVEPYNVYVNFPNGTQEYVNSPSSDMTGITVTCAEKTVTFATTAAFWNAYADRLRQSGTLSFNIEMNALTGADNTKNAYPIQAYYNYTYVAPETEVASANPEVGSYSLDDREYGFNNITLTFADNFAENISLQSGDALPSGMTLTLPEGVTRGQIWANSGSKTLNIGLTGGKVAGDYRVQIAEGTFSFENATFGQGVNAAVDKTWTLTAATTFRVNAMSITATGSEGNEFTAGGSLKKLASFKVNAPEGKTFASVTSTATVQVSVGEEEPAEVSATVTLADGVVTFTFPEAYTAEGSVGVSVPAGVITTEDALTSKAFTANFTIQPYDYFDITVDPATGSSNTGRLNTIVVTLPVGKTAATVGEAITLNGNSVNVTNVIAGNTVTLTLAEDFPYITYNYYSIPAGFIVDTEGNKNNAIYPNNITVVKQMEYVSATVGGETTTTNSVTVEKFQNFYIYFDENMGDNYNFGNVTGMTFKKDGEDVRMNGYVNSGNDNFFFYGYEYSDPGTYTLHIPAGVFTSEAGNTNAEVNFNIVIPEPEYFAAMTVSPATGTTMESLRTIILTAPDGVTFDNVKGLQGYPTVNESRDYMYGGYEFAEDNKSVTINISERTTDGNYTVTFPDGFVRSTDGKWSPELTATYTVSYPWFTLNSYNVTPAAGEVPSINGITIAAPAGITFATPAANVNIVVNGVETPVGASLNGEGRIVLAYTATKADRYEISIPAETFTSADGFKKNKALTGLTYTIQPTLSINANSVDDKGNYWTTFCLNKDFTLEDGYTPYIVRDNGNGGVKLVELLGTPIVNNYDVPFTTIDEVEAATHTASTITHANIADKYEITYSMSSRDGWNSWNGFDYIDVSYSTKFYVRVLDPAYTPNEILPFIYDCGSFVSSGNYSVTQTADDSFTLEVTGQTVGGLRFEVATGTYNKPIVPAETGILVKGAAKSGITYTPASGTKADVSYNLLWGCTQSELKEVGNDKYIYKLAWASEAYNDFGFYWGSANGHSIQANSGKAYLILNADQSSYSNRMLIFGGQDEETTDINRFDTANDNATIYTLQGKPISGEHLPAGIYIKNGRKFIVK